jgi:hypothetical protein
VSELNVAGCALLLTTALACQQPPRWTVEPVEGAAAVAVGVLWPLQNRDAAFDAGVGALLAACRADRARARAPRCAVTMHVDGEVACVVGVAGAADANEALAFAAALLDDAAEPTDDAIALATARAALRADDERWLIPGTVLALRARAAFGVVYEPIGDAAAMLQHTPERVRELLREPVGTAAAARGAIDTAMAARLTGLALPDPRRSAGRTASWHPPGHEVRREEVHPRVDQPFVMASFRVPDGVATATLAVAIEVARARGAREFRLRGRELRAETPLVAWSWLAGETVVRFHRRGTNFVQLLRGQQAPADAVAEGQATARELEAFLVTLRQDPPTTAEVAMARTRVCAEAGLDAADAASCAPEVLGGRLRAAMLARYRRVDRAAIESVTAAGAAAALAATLDPARGYWHTLLPAPRKDHGWPRR